MADASTPTADSTAPVNGQAEGAIKKETAIERQIVNVKITTEEQLKIELEKSAEKAEIINEMSDLLNKRLYQELSVKFMEYLKDPLMPSFDKMMFFHKVVFPNRVKIGLFAHVNILRTILEDADAQSALEFLEVTKDSLFGFLDAQLIFSATKALHLVRSQRYKDAEALLEEIKTSFDENCDLDIIVNACYHRAYSSLYLAASKYGDFCKNALLFLAYTPMSSMSRNEKINIGMQLALAALVAEDMYDFGDLIQHPIISEELKNSENGWIVDLLFAFDEGRLDVYNKMLKTHNEQFNAAGLTKNMDAINRKITLFALLDYVFRKPKRERKIAFEEIASHCYVAPDKVESLVMKALSLSLIRGEIDEVNQCVKVKWVKPRILDSSRLDLMRQRINLWCQSAKELLNHVSESTAELLVS